MIIQMKKSYIHKKNRPRIPSNLAKNNICHIKIENRVLGGRMPAARTLERSSS
jgi:hypothetical protein